MADEIEKKAKIEIESKGAFEMSDPPVDFFPSTYQDTDASAYGSRSALNTSMDPYASASFDDEEPLLDGTRPSPDFCDLLSLLSRALALDVVLKRKEAESKLISSLPPRRAGHLSEPHLGPHENSAQSVEQSARPILSGGP